jgi:hypothetical protein
VAVSFIGGGNRRTRRKPLPRWIIRERQYFFIFGVSGEGRGGFVRAIEF